MGRGWGWCPGLLWELQCRCLYGLWQLSSAAVPPLPAPPLTPASPFSGQVHILSINSCIPLPRHSKLVQYPSRGRLMNKRTGSKGTW